MYLCIIMHIFIYAYIIIHSKNCLYINIYIYIYKQFIECIIIYRYVYICIHTFVHIYRESTKSIKFS